MSAGVWFWIIYIILGLFGGFWACTGAADRRWVGGGVVVFVLLGLLGWGIFGPPIR